MQAAKRAGEHVGPPRRLTADKFDLALQLIEEGKGKAIAAHEWQGSISRRCGD